jgi:hypothetical protein
MKMEPTSGHHFTACASSTSAKPRMAPITLCARSRVSAHPLALARARARQPHVSD